VDTVENLASRTNLKKYELIDMLDFTESKYYDWKRRYGQENKDNGNVPKSHWILPEERERIIDYCEDRITKKGYRKLAYEMLDKGIVAVSASTVYNVLKEEDMIIKDKESKVSHRKKGEGYNQPESPHEQWHTDISYIKVDGQNYFLISVLDGYSRYILSHDLRVSMGTKDVENVVQKAVEKFEPDDVQLISDNGTQYVSNQFRTYVNEISDTEILNGELDHVTTSVNYPQSNGKIERFHRTIKEESVRRDSYVSLEDARERIAEYIEYYNTERLHASLDYLTPEDKLYGREEQRKQERDKKLEKAKELRKNIWKNEKRNYEHA